MSCPYCEGEDTKLLFEGEFIRARIRYDLLCLDDYIDTEVTRIHFCPVCGSNLINVEGDIHEP